MLDTEAKKIIIVCGDFESCGDSGGCDGAPARCKHWEFACSTARARRLDTEHMDFRLRKSESFLATNPHNMLCGPAGVARRYGPQKGATHECSKHLASAMQN